jgi:short subunit dehydrogenase-like uncharacterized protein
VSPRLDLIVFGATGFTGRLVAEYLSRSVGADAPLRWALAGRDAARLAAVRDAIGAPATLPLCVADAADPQALHRLVAGTRAVITTVGPYQRHGTPLVEACARAGTDYVDLCGEQLWMADMIPRLQPEAMRSGARIVFSCGFDSIPFDLGVVFLQDAARRRFGQPLAYVKGRVRVMKGTASGGTVASLLASVERMAQDPALRRTMADPFALTPGFIGPQQPAGDDAVYDADLQSWAGPFVMATINTKNVHRTNALRGHPWGAGFRYDERQLTGDGPAGERRARRRARTTWLQNQLLSLAPARALLRRFVLPRPGQGPDAHAREAGRYELVFSGETADGRRLQATVTGDRDPGYGSTSKMIAEAARCLLDDVDRAATPGGVWTPGAAMGLALVRRLQAQAGLRFELGA